MTYDLFKSKLACNYFQIIFHYFERFLNIFAFQTGVKRPFIHLYNNVKQSTEKHLLSTSALLQNRLAFEYMNSKNVKR
jgi:hypothetical protein